MDLYPAPDIGHVSFSGLSEPCSIGSIVEVVINAHGDSSAGSIIVEAIAPSGSIKNCQVLKKGSIFTATFTPNEVGKWQISILYDGDHIRGSPFSCKVYDANLVQVYGLDVGLVGQELKFSVNASQAGDGFLKVSVLRHGRSMPCEVLEQGNSGVYRISFTPDGAGQYKIHVLFNNMEVKGSPFILDIADASSVSVYGENLRMASVDRLNTFFIHAVGAECKDITVTITAPSGKSKRARVYQTDDVTYKVEWKPVEAGEHSIDVRLFNQSVYESPFVCNVGDPDLVTVRNMPEFINADEIFRDYTFEIDASAAGSGNLEIMINGGRVACRVRELGGRHYLASFTPTQAITHIVEMRFNGENVRMSPWKIQVRGSQHQTNPDYEVEERMIRSIESRRVERTESWYTELSGIGLQRASVGKPTTFEITGDGITEADVQARIYGPDAIDLPISIYRRGDQKLICEYVINKVGDHYLEMTICGKKIDPYPLTVSGYSAENVKIEPLGGGTPGQPVQFIVDAVDAGKGQLEISINQGKVPNNVQMQGAGRCLVTFIPQYPGKYVIDVTFNGEQVQGCPIRVDILPKQVGQNISTPIISQQTATITSSPSVQKPTSYGLAVEGNAESSGSPVVLKHTREKSLDRSSIPEHSKSPDLLRKAEPSKGATPIAESRQRSRKIDDYDPIAREKERETDQTATNLTEKEDGRLGYMIAQYGNGTIGTANVTPGQTISSRTFTDDGRGIVTSTYTAETRYSNVSPARTYEYAKGTMTNLPHDERIATPTMYKEIRAFEIPKTKELVAKSISSDSSHNYSLFLDPSRSSPSGIIGYDTKAKVKSLDQLESGSSFITDSRRYDSKSLSSEYRDLDSSSYSIRQYGTGNTGMTDQKQTQLKYFGEESIKLDGSKTSRNDIDILKTTYEPYRSSVNDLIQSGGYVRNKLDSDKLYSNGYLKHDDESSSLATKGPSFEAPIIASYGRARSDISIDRQQKASQKPIIPSMTILERTEEMERLPRNWKSIEQMNTGIDEQNYRNMNARLDDGRRCYDSLQFTEESFQTLSRDRDMEPTFLPTAPQRTADYMRTREEEKFGTFREMDSILSSQRFSKIEYGEREGHISEIVEEAVLTPRTRRKLQEQKIRHEEELDEKREEARKAIKDDLHSMQALDRDEFELSQSKPSTPSPISTPRATPRLSLKFGKEKEKKGIEEGGFNFGKSKITSKHEIVRRGKDVDVKVDSLKLGKDDQLKVVVVLAAKGAVEREEIEPKVKKSRHSYEISFRPSEVGTHKVMVYVNDTLHPMCPFPIRVYDASEIIVGEIASQSTINDTVEFTVDAGRAGFGNLEMAIKDSDGIIIPSHVAQLETGTAKFLVTFNPTTIGMHTVNITFNKEVLKNSPFEVNIVDEKSGENMENVLMDGKKKNTRKEKEEKKREEKERVKKEKEEKLMAETLKKNKGKETKKKKHQMEKRTSVSKIPSLSRVGRPAQILITLAGDEQLDITVIDPERRKIESSMSDHEPGVKKIEFIPVQVGDHEIEVKYAGADVQGSPFTCRAYDPAKISVGDIPNSVVDRPVHFIVDASQAGVGNLEVAVNEGRIPSMAQSLGQHRYDISFVPRELADHTISVRFNNEPVPGSPFICRLVMAQSITVSGPGLERIPVGQIAQIYVAIEGMKDMLPQTHITDSQGNNIPVSISKSDTDDKKYIISYTPKNVGNHQIDISCDGKPVTGSPFTSKAFDAKCAKLSCIEEAIVGRPCTFMIDAARAGAGNMEIIVSVENRNVPNFVQAEGQAKFKVSFTPQEAKDHLISVRFNGDPIPGSPMVCPVRGRSSQSIAGMSGSMNTGGMEQEIRLVGDLTVGQVGQTKGFSIDTGGRETDCNVAVIDSHGHELDVEVEKVCNGYHVQFRPLISGEHKIDIVVNGQQLGIGPFVMEVLEPPKIARIPSTILAGKEIIFELDISNVARRNVKVEVKNAKNELVPAKTEIGNDGIVRAFCTFHDVGRYSVDVFINEMPYGERQYIRVIQSGRGAVLVDEIEQALVGWSSKLIIRTEPGAGKHLSVVIVDPERNPVPTSLKKLPDEIFEVEFIPRTEGVHNISVLVGDEHIRGSPFKISVLDLSAVRVIGLKNDRVGIEQCFNVDWSNSGGTNAAVRVTYGGKEVSCTMKRIKKGLHMCSFIPRQVGLHLIDVLIDEMLLPECPYECVISDAGSVRACGDALTRAQRGKTARFEVSLNDTERGELDVVVSDSRGRPLPVRCYKQHDDSYWVEFAPENIGLHQIEITFADTPITGSPFKCIVVDPRKVFIKGISEPFIVKQPALITVNRQLAGGGDLTVELIDPSNEPVRLDMQTTPDGDDIFEFTPTKIGQYKLSTKLAGFLVNGTPHTLIVEEHGKPVLRGSATEHPVEVDRPTSIIFDAKNVKGNLKIDVRGPKKTKVRHSANKNADGTTEISFTPTEVGRYLVSIEHNSRTIPGSPFEIEVVDPRKVIVNDNLADEHGIYQFAVQQRNVIDVDATAAGSGKLRAEVRDWDGKPVSGCDVESLGYGKYRVTYYPQQSGKYGIYLYWSDMAVQKAQPLHVIAEGEQPSTSRAIPLTNTAMATSHNTIRSRSEDHQSHGRSGTDYLRVVLRGEGLTRATNNEQAEFIIDGSDVAGDDGQISCSLFGQKADIPVRLTHLGNNVYKAVYTPLISGIYELQVLWDGHHVRGSPFRVQVDLHSSAADAIVIDANTLKMGIVNEDVKTVIDTRKAGAGQLSAQCMGPTKLAYCELYDLRDGTYTLSVRPSEIGKHTLVVKYSDEQVPGSPFVFNVSYPPDASKVRVYGPGIEHGILSTFKSNFVVETKGAGAGQLTVRVRGPKGAFNVEMQREKKQERTIHCKYEPKEPGDYQVEVKWHGEHVPGSPFLVMIVDTEQELQRFLCGDAPSPQPATPFIPPGWIGTPPPPPLFLGGPPPRGPFLQPHAAVLPLPSPTIQGTPLTGAHGSLMPYGTMPQPPHAMRTVIRPRFMSGY
ncbi:Filamin/ABP280 repeat family protein [Acanthocheilonema viteae]